MCQNLRLRLRWLFSLSSLPEEHHWDSQGIPSPSPSIFVLGQFLRKYVASTHDVICEQCILPSQRNELDDTSDRVLIGFGCVLIGSK